MATKETCKLRRACWDNEVFGFVKKVTQELKPSDFTDGAGTSGYVDLTDKIPADCLILGWTAKTTVAWDDDTTATIAVGKSGTTDDLSAGTSGSVAAVGTIGNVCKTLPVHYNESEYTVRVTITGGSDFTAFVTKGDCRTTINVYYMELN